MTREMMLEALNRAADPAYGAYQKKIVSDTAYPMLYVRMPALRKIAAAVSKADWKRIAVGCEGSSYEEVLTVCLAVAGADAVLEDRISVLEPLLHMLDSWAMTDSIVPTLRVKPEERSLAWDFAVKCICREEEYVRRFGIVLLLNYFLEPQWLDAVEKVVVSVKDQRYYVSMACAWLLAEMAVTDWTRVERILRSGKLDVFVHNMTIRKIRESLRIANDVKAAAAALKRKDKEYV